MLSRNLMMLRSSMANQGTGRSLVGGIAKRNFSSAPAANNTPAYIMGAIGMGGLAYLTFMTSELGGARQQAMARGETTMSSIVQDRLGKTFGYFGWGIMTTSAFVYYMRHSMVWARMNPWMMMGASLGLMFGTHAMPYDNAMWLPKLGMYTLFSGVIGMSILPLVQMSAAATVADAALVTGLTMTGLGGIAYNAPSEQFLSWGQPLAFACLGMMGISMLSMFRP